MMACILALYILTSGGFPPEARSIGRAEAAAPQADPDQLYARRDDLASAKQAADLWADRLQKNARDFESAWKLSKARYWLGGHAAEKDRKATLEAGIDAARTAVALEPNRPE